MVNRARGKKNPPEFEGDMTYRLQIGNENYNYIFFIIIFIITTVIVKITRSEANYHDNLY